MSKPDLTYLHTLRKQILEARDRLPAEVKYIEDHRQLNDILRSLDNAERLLTINCASMPWGSPI